MRHEMLCLQIYVANFLLNRAYLLLHSSVFAVANVYVNSKVNPFGIRSNCLVGLANSRKGFLQRFRFYDGTHWRELVGIPGVADSLNCFANVFANTRTFVGWKNGKLKNY